jgi:DNA-binding CsgD family transcriptional regulator/predicted Zn-dependent protease
MVQGRKARLNAKDPRSLFERGEYTACIEALAHRASDEDFVLRLRALIRLNRYNEALRVDALDRISKLAPALRFTGYTLLATASYRASMRLPAENYFNEAYRLADEFDIAQELRAELHYFDALRQWSAHNFDAAEQLVTPLLELRAWRLTALELLAWIAAGRGDLDQQMELFGAALECRDGDIWNRATVLHSYSDATREMYRPIDTERIARSATSLPWSSDMAAQRFLTFRNLGLCEALSGRALRAFEYLRIAEDAIHDTLYQILVHADKAFIAFGAGELETARDNVLSALKHVDAVKWHSVGDRRVILLELVEVTSQLGDIPTAEALLTRYDAIVTQITPLQSYGVGDQRLKATEQYARGLLLRAKGKSEPAVSCLKDAFRIWNQVGYKWRAVLAALAIGIATGKRDLFDYAVITTDKHFPHAWFSRSLDPYRSRAAHPELQNLSDTRQGILLGIVDGKTNKEIADHLGISPNVVRNRLADLFTNYGVRSRRRLREILRERGVQ